MGFGELLKKKRKEQKISQRELAKAVGVDFTYISKIENEILPPPAEETIRKLANVLDADGIEWILSAGKIPGDFQKIIFNEPNVVKFLRNASELTESEWKEIHKIINS